MIVCKKVWFTSALTLVFLLSAGSSSTTLGGSWKSPYFSGKVAKIYVVGVSKQETNRRIFEDGFARHLNSYGVTGVSSYRDLPSV